MAGTVAGAWFNETNPSDGNGFAIALTADQMVMMTGDGQIDVRVNPGEATWKDPRSVTALQSGGLRRWCYQGWNGNYAYLELVDDMTLAVSSGAGQCPNSMPQEHQIFVR
jgi:hypothetical protein